MFMLRTRVQYQFAATIAALADDGAKMSRFSCIPIFGRVPTILLLLDQLGWTFRVYPSLMNVVLIHVCCRGRTAFFVITLDMKVSSALGMVTRRYFAMATRSNVDSTGVGDSSGIYVELCQRMDSVCCRQH